VTITTPIHSGTARSDWIITVEEIVAVADA
jgi:hypothetical protein